MMQAKSRNKLDPRTRRIAAIAEAASEIDLRREVRRGTLTAAGVDVDTPLTPEMVTVRVLVKLSAGATPPISPPATWINIVDQIYGVAIAPGLLSALADHRVVEIVEAGRQLAPMLSTSVPETRADRVRQAPDGLDGSGVVIGIVDFGFDLSLDDFRNPDGTTRVAFLWDQSLQPVDGEASPARFPYGVEYNRTAIDGMLVSDPPTHMVRHAPFAGAHGTHVAGIATGSGRSHDADFSADTCVGVAPGATIIFVQPEAGDAPTTFTDSVHVAEAVSYIFEKAKELGLPCVINMSLGQNGGSHDGESLVERAIDRLLEEPGRAIVLAAGNEHIWRGHAAGTLVEGQSHELRWHVGGGMPVPGGSTGTGPDLTANELELWYSSRDEFHITLIAPDGEASATAQPGETIDDTFSGGEPYTIDSLRFSPLNGDAQVYVQVSPSPAGHVRSGTWRVKVDGVRVRDGRFDAWIERDARRDNNNFADQSFFVGADFVAERTLGTPATARRAISVANYVHKTEAPEDSSSRGPTRDGRPKPEIAAPGTMILSSCAGGGQENPKKPGTYFPMRIPMTGTSMAAPHVTGIVAQLLQRRPDLRADQLRKIVIASARPVTAQTGFDTAWGFGRVDAEAAVALLP